MTNYFWSAAIFLFIAHIVTWVQLNGQFKWEWFKEHENFVVLIFAFPVAWLFINYQRFAYLAFDGSLWSLRLMGFSGGIIVFFFMTWLLMGELPSVKNMICLMLACLIIVIQTLLK